MNISRILAYSAALIIMAVVLWTIRDDLIGLLSNVSPAWLLLTAICWISAFVIRGARWKMLLSPIERNISFSSSFWSISMSYLVNLIVPTKWGSELARAFALSRKENASLLSTLSSIVVEKIQDLFSMVILASTALVFIPSIDLIPSWVFHILKILAVLAVVSITGLFMMSWKSLSFIAELKRRINSLGRIGRTLTTALSFLVKGVEWIVRNPKPFVWSFTLTFTLWLVFSMGIYAIFSSLGTAPHPLIVILGSLLFSFAYVLPNVPGYVGTYEGMWALVFLGLGVGGNQTVLAGALVGHLISTTITVTLGSIGLVRIGLNLAESLKMRSIRMQDLLKAAEQ